MSTQGKQKNHLTRTLEEISSCSNEPAMAGSIALHQLYGDIQLVVGGDECALPDLEHSGAGGWRVKRWLGIRYCILS